MRQDWLGVTELGETYIGLGGSMQAGTVTDTKVDGPEPMGSMTEIEVGGTDITRRVLTQ